MSLLTEVSKTVINAQLAFTSLTSSSVSNKLASELLVQPYIQVGDPIAVPDSVQGTFCLGAFDGNTTTFVYPVIFPSGAAEVQIYANSAAFDAPPNFSLAARVPVVGSAGLTYYAMTAR